MRIEELKVFNSFYIHISPSLGYFYLMDKQAPTIIGESTALAAALDHISRLAGIDRPALIVGERGTGKSLPPSVSTICLPAGIRPLRKLTAALLTETLLESELFGHETGAFTGATKQHIGRFELTDGGTLFLDELATMSPRLQEKLLRVIEYGEFERRRSKNAAGRCSTGRCHQCRSARDG